MTQPDLDSIQAKIGKPNSPERETVLDRVFGPEDGAPEDAVAWLRSAADALNTATKGYDPSDWRDALRLLHSLRVVTARISQVDANLARWLYLHGEHGQHQTLDGIPGPFYIGRGRDSERWESAAAVQEYVDRKVQQHEGEFTPESVVEWVLEILPATASTALRKTAIKAAGMELDLYYTSEPGRIRIDLPKPPG